MTLKRAWLVYRDVWVEKIVRFNASVFGAVGLSALIVLFPIAMVARFAKLDNPPPLVVAQVLAIALIGIIALGSKLGPWAYRVRSIFLLRVFGVNGTFICCGAVSLAIWLTAKHAPMWVLLAPGIAWAILYFLSAIIYELREERALSRQPS